MIENLLGEIVAAVLIALSTNLDRIVGYVQKRRSWFRPEFELRRGERFDIVTSSLKVEKPPDAPAESHDETIIGDMAPVLEVIRGRAFAVKHFLPEAFPHYRNDANIMSFGGEVGNPVTAFFLEKLKCPLRFDNYRIVDEIENIRYEPLRDEIGRIQTDYAIVAKAPNPTDPQNVVYVFAGIHKPGTFGAALCTRKRHETLVTSRTRGMRGFAALVEVDVSYLMPGRDALSIICPVRIVTLYALPHNVLI